MAKKDKNEARTRRKQSIRKRISGTSERPRLSVYRSNKYIYAQVIDDSTGRTLAHVSTLSKDLKGSLDDGSAFIVYRGDGLIQAVAALNRDHALLEAERAMVNQDAEALATLVERQ